MFAWTEKDVDHVLTARGIPEEPLFCMETALKCLFWSESAYEYTRDIPVCMLGWVHAGVLYMMLCTCVTVCYDYCMYYYGYLFMLV